jgi:hypothetical protein
MHVTSSPRQRRTKGSEKYPSHALLYSAALESAVVDNTAGLTGGFGAAISEEGHVAVFQAIIGGVQQIIACRHRLLIKTCLGPPVQQPQRSVIREPALNVCLLPTSWLHCFCRVKTVGKMFNQLQRYLRQSAVVLPARSQIPLSCPCCCRRRYPDGSREKDTGSHAFRPSPRGGTGINSICNLNTQSPEM